MELRVYLDFLRRRWLLLALGPVLAGLAAYFVSQQLTPMYSATATILVNRTAAPNIIDYTDVLTSERLTNTYAQLVERPAVLEEVKKRLNLSVDRSVLEAKISSAPIKDTQLISLSVKDADPGFAAQLANTTAQAFIEDNASQLSPAGAVTVAKPADVPKAPYSPKVVFNLAFAVVLGGVAVIGLGLLLDYLDDTVKTSQDIENVDGLVTLGMIGRFKAETGPAFAKDQHSRTAEAYRQLRTNVHFTALGSELKTMVITSANAEEGKSTTAANLATVLAQAGDRVILVDTDLRRSSLRKTFDAQQSFGLTGLLLNDIQDPSLALVATRWKNLQLLPAGVLPPNPSELLTSARMIRVIQTLRQMADYVIFDSPPILAVTDAIVLAARTDGAILVTEAGGTRSDALRQAARTLKQANARVIGVVLNKAKVSHAGGYYYRDDEDLPVELSPDAPRQEARRAVATQVATPRPAIVQTPVAIEAPITLVRATQQPVVAQVAPKAPVAAVAQPVRVATPIERVASIQPSAPAAKPEPARPAPAPAMPPESKDAFLEHRLAALRERYQTAGSPDVAAEKPSNGNGHQVAPPAAEVPSNGNGHTNGNGAKNGNGNGHQVPAPEAAVPHNGNGHRAAPQAGDLNGGSLKPNGNGNGHTVPAREQLAPLSPEMKDLLARLDDTVGMIRALKPGGESEPA